MTRGSLNEKQPSSELLLLLLLWERMSESVGGEVGAFKPQQVGNSDRFTSPCSYTMDLTSCLPAHTHTEKEKTTRRDRKSPERERDSGEGRRLWLF